MVACIATATSLLAFSQTVATSGTLMADFTGTVTNLRLSGGLTIILR